MKAGTILFSEMTPPPELEEAFNAWYDDEHIPLRMAVPGFLGAQRYCRKEDGKYLAVYDMESAAILGTAAYLEVKDNPSDLTRRMLSSVSGFSRYIGNHIGTQRRDDIDGDGMEAPVLYAVFFNVPEDRHGDFNEWYEVDHVPALLQSKDWLMCRRFAVTLGEPWDVTHLALHYLGSAAALDSEERKAARSTEWRARLAKEPWFKAEYLLFQRLGRRFAPKG
jgi:hypothetical protein